MKKKKDQYDKYDHLPVDVIRRALRGDSAAWEEVICRYRNYAHVCITNSASVYKVDPNTLPRDELMQEIWLKVAEVIGKKFTIR